jgi:hypothetical protein
MITVAPPERFRIRAFSQPACRKLPNDQRRSRWEPPPDSDLIGIPLIVGMAVALLAIALAFVFLGGLGGLIVVGIVLIAALAISYRVVTSSDTRD